MAGAIGGALRERGQERLEAGGDGRPGGRRRDERALVGPLVAGGRDGGAGRGVLGEERRAGALELFDRDVLRVPFLDVAALGGHPDHDGIPEGVAIDALRHSRAFAAAHDDTCPPARKYRASPTEERVKE